MIAQVQPHAIPGGRCNMARRVCRSDGKPADTSGTGRPALLPDALGWLASTLHECAAPGCSAPAEGSAPALPAAGAAGAPAGGSFCMAEASRDDMAVRRVHTKL